MTESHSKQRGLQPGWIALGFAIFGVLAMLIVDHGPWSRARVQTAEVASQQTTAEAARVAGAAVEPTAPKPTFEPQAARPKPAQPAVPESD